MSATRKPEMSRAQKAIERVHHKIMDMRDSTPMRDGSIEAEENYLKVYKKAYRESQSSTYFAAAERYRLFLQGKPVPGAPLQPGATQPEHDGGQMKEKVLCELCGEPMPKGEEMFNYHGQSGPCPKPPLPKPAPEKLFTHSELTTLLERMARLVVEEATNHLYVQRLIQCSCGANVNGPHGWADHLRSEILSDSRLQQLREAVERP